MDNINKNSLIIFGYSEILTIGLVVNSKLYKVKEFSVLEDNNEDEFFKIISNFIPYETYFNSIYYSCGPGGFTIIRRVISFVKALKFHNYSNTKFIGLNHLFIIACYLNHNFKINDKEYILAILNHYKDVFVQIFQKKTNSYFLLDSLSDIKNIELDAIEKYLKTFNLPIQNVHLVYLGTNPKFKLFIKNILIVDRSNLFKEIIKISKMIENNKLSQTDFKYIFKENFNPIYGKSPSTN